MIFDLLKKLKKTKKKSTNLPYISSTFYPNSNDDILKPFN